VKNGFASLEARQAGEESAEVGAAESGPSIGERQVALLQPPGGFRLAPARLLDLRRPASATEQDLRPALAEPGQERDDCVEVDRLLLRPDLEQVALETEVEGDSERGR
jgi:hypothetical protein